MFLSYNKCFYKILWKKKPNASCFSAIFMNYCSKSIYMSQLAEEKQTNCKPFARKIRYLLPTALLVRTCC